MTSQMTPTRRSYYANAAAAAHAIDLALPMIERAMQDPRICASGFLYIVVMDPALRPGNGVAFSDAVLMEHAVGDRRRWDADYAGFARAKARLSWEGGADSHLLQQLQPQGLREGDSLLWGSVNLDGIVVAISGAEAWFDEAFATGIAANLRALAKQRHAADTQAKRLVASAATACH